MDRVLIITDVNITGKSKAGNVNAIRFLEKVFNQSGEAFLLSFDRFSANSFLQTVIFNLIKIEMITWRRLKKFFNVKLTLINYKYSFFLCIYIYFLTRFFKCDTVVVEYLSFHYLNKFIPKRVFKIIDTHDLMFARCESYLKLNLKPPEEIIISKENEMNLLGQFDSVIAIQKEELSVLKEQNINAVLLPRADLNITRKIPSNDLKILGFIGGRADFNKFGIEKFLKEIWTETGIDDFELYIYGGVSKRIEVDINRYNNVKVIGEVNDIDDVYDCCDIMINPIYFGSGLKTKNIESICHSIPILTTQVGLEGLLDLEDRYIFRFNDRNDFYLKLKYIEMHYIDLIESCFKFSKNNFSLKEIANSFFESLRLVDSYQ